MKDRKAGKRYMKIFVEDAARKRCSIIITYNSYISILKITNGNKDLEMKL